MSVLNEVSHSLALVQCFTAPQAVMLFTTVPPLVILLADMKHFSCDALCLYVSACSFCLLCT